MNNETTTISEQVMLEQALLMRHATLPDHKAELRRIMRSRRRSIGISRLWWVAVAAVMLAIIGFGTIYNNKEKALTPPVVENIVQAPVPSAHTPTDRQVPVQKAVSVSAPRKKIYHLSLPDGSEVWLNSESQLYYPAQFHGEERRVRLVGEGFFQVKKNRSCPFVVESRQITTTAYGTAFNMKTYEGEECRVTLLDGMVTVESEEGRQCVQLAPGEDALLESGGKLAVTGFDREGYERWNDGYFYYDNVPLRDVLRDISRWYDVRLSAANDSVRVHFVARWDEMPLADVLELLGSFTGTVITKS